MATGQPPDGGVPAGTMRVNEALVRPSGAGARFVGTVAKVRSVRSHVGTSRVPNTYCAAPVAERSGTGSASGVAPPRSIRRVIGVPAGSVPRTCSAGLDARTPAAIRRSWTVVDIVVNVSDVAVPASAAATRTR